MIVKAAFMGINLAALELGIAGLLAYLANRILTKKDKKPILNSCSDCLNTSSFNPGKEG